jgi:hypothetical protein
MGTMRSQWQNGMARIVHQSDGGAGMRRSEKNDKLLGSSSKTFTIKGCSIYRNGQLITAIGIVRRADLAEGSGYYKGLHAHAIGGNSMGWTQVWSIS